MPRDCLAAEHVFSFQTVGAPQSFIERICAKYVSLHFEKVVYKYVVVLNSWKKTAIGRLMRHLVTQAPQCFVLAHQDAGTFFVDLVPGWHLILWELWNESESILCVKHNRGSSCHFTIIAQRAFHSCWLRMTHNVSLSIN